MKQEIIDAHVHPFLTDEQNAGFWFYGKSQTPQEFAQSLFCAGVTHFCGSVIRNLDTPYEFEEILKLNRAAFELKNIFGGIYTPGIHIHPDYPRESCEELEKFHKLGVWLIGELVWSQMKFKTYMQGGGHEIFSLAQELHMVVNIHPTTVEDIETLAKNFPKLPIIVAHPGDKSVFLERLELMKRYPNLFQDLAGTGLFRNGVVRYGIDHVGCDRFIYGSDYPICNPGMYVAGVQYEELTDSEREAVFSGNFWRLEASAQ